MTKKEYLEALNEGLTRLPAEEARKSCAYYAEMIDDRIEEGLTEEEAVAAMEPPRGAAERILYDAPLSVLAKGRADERASRPKRSGLSTALLILGSPLWLPLLCVFAGVALSLYAAAWATVLTLLAGMAAVALSGALAALYGVYALSLSGLGGLATIGAGFLCAGAGLLLSYPCAALARGLGVGTVRSLKRLFIGRRQSA